MDSSFMAGLFGVVGTLSGTIMGAWLNPLIQDWHNKRQVKHFIDKCNQLEKFVLLTAYRTAYLPINNIKISNFSEFNNEDMFILNNLDAFCRGLALTIQRLKEEGKIFATLKENECNSGYMIALHSDISNFINSNKQMKDMLFKEVNEFIANQIYPHYKLMLKDSIFSKIEKTIITKYVVFLNSIGVIDIYNRDLSHLNFDNPKSYLELPKGIFHPEYNKK